MPVFDISGVEVRQSYPVDLDQARACSQAMVLGYEPLGYAVTVDPGRDPRAFGAEICDDKGTIIAVTATFDDDGAKTHVAVTLDGTVHVGGVKGMMASEQVVRSVATDQLAGFMDKGFDGTERAAPAEPADEAPAPEPTPEPTPGPTPTPAAAETPESSGSPSVDALFARNYAEASDSEKDAAVRKAIQTSAVAAGAVTIQPIPLLDLALVTPIQATMVQLIGSIRGHDLDSRTIIELLGTFGTGIVTTQFVLAAAKFVPILGWAASITTAYAMTHAIGEVADAYFESGRRLSKMELRTMFQRVFTAKKREKESANKGNSSLKDKLGQLTAAYDAGVITEAEFTKKKEELLAAF